MYIHIYIYICIYIYIHIERERERERYTHTHTHMQYYIDTHKCIHLCLIIPDSPMLTCGLGLGHTSLGVPIQLAIR